MNANYKDSLNPTRFPDESFKDYKERMRYNNKRVKNYLDGRWIHKSKHKLETKGITYIKKDE